MDDQNNDTNEYESYIKFAKRCQRKPIIQNTLSIARSHQVKSHIELDTNPLLLNVLNGTIDLETGRLREHRASDLITKMAGCAYLPESSCPVWNRFLLRIFDNDEELIASFQTAIGYSITGLTSEQKFFVMYGAGANGKSTTENTISSVFGDYAQVAPPGLLMEKKHDAHPTELADLRGARAVTTSEIKINAHWDEEKVKMLTGGDSIRARQLYENYWEYVPTHKLWVSTNHRPATRDNSIGFWRRIVMFPFTECIPVHEQDPHLLNKLKLELPGILKWAIEGCLLWQRNGLIISQKIKEATSNYRSSEDVVGRFLDEQCLFGSELSIQANELFGKYIAWSRNNKESELSQKQFGEKVREHGILVKKSSCIIYLGINIKSVEPKSGITPIFSIVEPDHHPGREGHSA